MLSRGECTGEVGGAPGSSEELTLATWKEGGPFPGDPTCGPRRRWHCARSSRVSSQHSELHHPQGQAHVQLQGCPGSDGVRPSAVSHRRPRDTPPKGRVEKGLLENHLSLRELSPQQREQSGWRQGAQGSSGLAGSYQQVQPRMIESLPGSLFGT